MLAEDLFEQMFMIEVILYVYFQNIFTKYNENYLEILNKPFF